MNVQKVEQELLKGLQNPPQGRDHGLRYKLPDNKTLYIHPDGFRAYVLWPTDPLHLSEKCFPPIERLPFNAPDLTEENLLKPTGMETKLNNGKTTALIFQRTDGGKTYLNKGFLAVFDKTARLYQDGRDWRNIVAVVEWNSITREPEIVAYICPMMGPKES
jgi:hypothetical protein